MLGFESSCDETGVALVQLEGDAPPRLLAHALYSQVEMHQAFGGVVPELASRDHIRRVVPLTLQVLEQAGRTLDDVDVVAFTRGPGLAGALLVGAGAACALAAALDKPVIGIHHLEGHLLALSERRSARISICGAAGLWRAYPVGARRRGGALRLVG